MITVTALGSAPPFVQGLVRDLRVRWALEEAGLRYQARLVSREDQASDAYRALQPFGQVPAYEEDGLRLFESGAIVMHIAERSPALAPADPEGRARMATWMFAALTSIEPWLAPLVELEFNAGQDWARQRGPALFEAARTRLGALAAWLDGRDYLEDRFTAADLLMSTVLRIPRHTDLVAQFPVLDAYHRRCEARPAFQKALADQMADFARPAPAGG